MTTKRKVSKRAQVRLRRMRRDPFGRLCQEVGRYLETVKWRALVMGPAQVRGDQTTPGRLGRFEFVVKFTGGKVTSKGASE